MKSFKSYLQKRSQKNQIKSLWKQKQHELAGDHLHQVANIAEKQFSGKVKVTGPNGKDYHHQFIPKNQEAWGDHDDPGALAKRAQHPNVHFAKTITGKMKLRVKAHDPMYDDSEPRRPKGWIGRARPTIKSSAINNLRHAAEDIKSGHRSGKKMIGFLGKDYFNSARLEFAKKHGVSETELS